MYVRIASFIALVATIFGCRESAKDPLDSLNLPVTTSVAEKVLGDGAFSVDPFVGSDIRVPGIYHIKKNGYFAQICENDTSMQTDIVSMRKRNSSNSEIVEDSIAPIRVKVKYLTSVYEIPYRKIKVSGYEIVRVYSGDSGSPEDYILKNVGENCPGVLRRNRPYVIVTEVAIADNVETVSGGGVASVSFGIGPVTFDSEIVDEPERRRTKRVFAIRGTVVAADP